MDDKLKYSRILGERIKNLRLERGLTQSELANKSSMDIRQVGRIERGEAVSNINSIVKICLGLVIEPSDLLKSIEGSLHE